VRFFTCLLDPENRGIADVTRQVYESLPRARGLAFEWHLSEQIAVLTAWDDPYGDPLIAEEDGWVAVGMVRLDNRADLERWGNSDRNALTDLQLVLRVIARYGTRYIPQFLGDFAFVVWNGSGRTATAACDVFAVRKLYYTERDGLTLFTSRAETLALKERYEVRYLAELLTRSIAPSDITVFAGIKPVPAASVAVLEHGKLNLRRYWSVTDLDLDPLPAESEQEAVESCRRLLAESIQLRLGKRGETWAELSGGLDSSSIVGMTQWLAERGEIPDGLAGTLTLVGVEGGGSDERAYSDAVANRWRVRNEKIVNPPSWHDDQYAPPHLDQPNSDFQCYPRDYRMCTVIRKAGGRVLFTGWGGDELFTNNMFFFADWLIQGRVWPAIREMARRSAIGRVSFWELAYKNALLPLLPRVLHQRLVHDEAPVQSWLNRNTLRQYGLDPRLSVLAYGLGGRLGQKYHHVVLRQMGGLSRLAMQGLVADTLDVRHPMLYRPLVEFALRLPPNLRGRPHAHRWVLREAMRGILPERVRTRVGKGGTGEILAQVLATHRKRLGALLQNPVLAELGIVHADKLRDAFDATAYQTSPRQYSHGDVLAALGVEAWLQMRSGRWPRGGHISSTESVA
jgi:asparagine synthase (glutamine-hydrolysing)